MKNLKSSILFFLFVFAVQTVAVGSNIDDRDYAFDVFKQYINTMVEKVKQAPNPVDKREILNNSFDNMLSAFDKAEEMGIVSSMDKAAVKALRANIQEKKNELNGSRGYRRVADRKLNSFALYVQQDLEQADTIKISATVLLLIVIILILL